LSLDSYDYGSRVLLENVQINQNEAFIATMTISTYIGDAQLLSCSFAANIGQEISAGIRLQGVALFDSCTFLDHAFNVVFLDSASKSIFSECSFERNVMAYTIKAAPITISTGSPSVRFESCIFMSNEGYYGAIYADTSSLPIEISSSKFINNTATHGAAIYVDASSSLVVSDSLFELNQAGFSGTIVCSQSKSCQITSSIFESNMGLYGSGIYFYAVNALNYDGNVDENDDASFSLSQASSSMIVSDCLFNNNTNIAGGAVQIVYSTGVLIVNSTFYGNTYGNASSNPLEGSFLLEIESSSNTTVINSTFGYMRSEGCGVQLVSSQWTLFSNCSISSIQSFILSGGSAVLIRSKFSEDGREDQNDTEQNEGVPPYHASTTFVDCVFKNNVASEGYGGAIALQNATANLIRCIFDSNTAAAHNYGGGAIYVDSSSAIICDSCTFTNNIADYAFPGGGGAVYISGYGVFYNTMFYRNSANYSADGGGGAVFVSEFAKAIFSSGCSFINNWANYQKGGAVYQYSSDAAVYAPGTFFSRNFARDGGGIFLQDGGHDFVLQGLIFDHNNVMSLLHVYDLL